MKAKRLWAILLCVTLCLGLLPAPALAAGGDDAALTRADAAVLLADFAGLPVDYNPPFPDCDDLTGRQQAVIAAGAQAGMINGTAEGIFAPDDAITRAQMAVLIWRCIGSPSVDMTNKFTDVSETAFYYSAVTGLYHLGVIQTASDTFSPDDPVTVQDAAAWLIAARDDTADEIKVLVDTLALNGDASLTRLNAAELLAVFADLAVDYQPPFPDCGHLTGRQQAAIAAGAQAGMINGTAEGIFAPDDAITRAQMAVLIWRCIGSPSVDMTNQFTDVNEGVFYYSAVTGLYNLGVIQTASDTFSPDDPVTVQDAAAWLAAAEEYLPASGESGCAIFEINGTPHLIEQGGESDAVYTWDESRDDWDWEHPTALPTGVRYDFDTNTLTLDNAELETLGLRYALPNYDYDEGSGEWYFNGTYSYWLPNSDLTIELVGDSSIATQYTEEEISFDQGGYHCLSFGSGVNAVLTGSGTLTTAAQPSNDGNAILICEDSSLTITDHAAVSAQVIGEYWGWEDEDGNPIRTELAAISTDSSGVSLTVSGHATLNAVSDAAIRLHDGSDLTVTGEAALNADGSIRLETWDENITDRNTFTVSGGALTVESGNVYLHYCDLTVSGGVLTVNTTDDAPAIQVDDGSSYTQNGGAVSLSSNGGAALCARSGSTVSIGEDLHAVSGATGAELELRYNEDADEYYFTEDNTVWGARACRIVISSASGGALPGFTTDADDSTSVGQDVTVTFTANGDGTVIFDLGGLTAKNAKVNGAAYTGNLETDGVTLNGRTAVTFTVSAVNPGWHNISATLDGYTMDAGFWASSIATMEFGDMQFQFGADGSAWVWEEVAVEGEDDTEWTYLPISIKGVSYDPKTNTLTLDNAELDTLGLRYALPNYDYDEDSDEWYFNGSYSYWLPNPDLTIVLEGDSTIYNDNKDYNTFALENGVNAVITGSGSLTVTSQVREEDKYADHYSYPILLGDGASLTVTDNTAVTACALGDWWGWKDDESGENVKSELAAIGSSGDGSGVSLTVADSASLTLTGDRAVEFQNGDALTVSGGTLNANGTVRLEAWDEDITDRNTFTVCGGAVTVNARNDGIVLDNADLTVSGGALTVNVDGNCGINIDRDSTMTVSGGAVHVSFPVGEGIRVGGNPEFSSALIQTGGTLTVVSTYSLEAYGDEGASAICVNDSYGFANTAVFSGGTATLKGRLGLDVGQGAELTIQGDAAVTVETIEDPYNWAVVSVAGDLNVYGGSLTVNAVNSNAINLNYVAENAGGNYTQTGGTVTLKVTEPDPDAPAYAHGIEQENGVMTISGGTLNISSDFMGIDVVGQFTLLGGTVNVHGGMRGVQISGAALLSGGSLNAGVDVFEGGYQAVFVGPYAESSLTVTGGNHSFLAPTGSDMLGLWAVGAAVFFEGGSVRLTGDMAMEWYGELGFNTEDGANGTAIADGLHAVSNVTGNELNFVQFVENGSYQAPDGVTYDYTAYRYRFTENGLDTGAACTDVTISPTPGEQPVAYAATLEITSGQASVGAPVNVKAVVAAQGIVSFPLPEGLELIAGSVSVNGKVYSGGLENIEIDGSAVIRFSVKPTEPVTYTIRSVTIDNTGEHDEETSFTAQGFQIAAPTDTTTEDISATGRGTPGDEITLRVTGEHGNTRTFTGTVSSLGTFSIPITLPVSGITEEDFTVEVFLSTLSTETPVETLCVTYDPDSVSVNVLYVTNVIHDGKGTDVDVTVTVDYAHGGLVYQSYYTYWPDRPDFDFAVEFDIPDGYEVQRAFVEVIFQDGSTKEVELEEPGPGDHDQWKGRLEPESAKPPVGYRVGWIAGPAGAGFSDAECAYTGIRNFIPIMDPSGKVYSGSKDHPVAGATVTLYYGGDGETPDADHAEIFDMTNYGQINPQITDAAGGYGWNVPAGWWKIVAEKDGYFTAESEWLRVLPAQENVDLELKCVMVDGSTVQISAAGIPDGAKHLIAASYDSAGKMLESIVVDIEDENTVTFTFADISSAHNIKVYYLDSAWNPLCQESNLEV